MRSLIFLNSNTTNEDQHQKIEMITSAGNLKNIKFQNSFDNLKEKNINFLNIDKFKIKLKLRKHLQIW